MQGRTQYVVCCHQHGLPHAFPLTLAAAVVDSMLTLARDAFQDNLDCHAPTEADLIEQISCTMCESTGVCTVGG